MQNKVTSRTVIEIISDFIAIVKKDEFDDFRALFYIIFIQNKNSITYRAFSEAWKNDGYLWVKHSRQSHSIGGSVAL